MSFAIRSNWPLLLTFALCGAGSAAAQDNARTIPIVTDGPVADWIMDEATGRVFAALASEPAVVEFSPESGKEVRRFRVGEGCREVLVKGNHLVVGASVGVSLHVIDLKEKKVTGRVALDGRGPYGLFCSKAGNPYVYALCNTGDAWWDGEVFQVDVARRKVRNRAAIHTWRHSGARHVAMSADGRFAVADQRGSASPSGAGLMSVDEENFTFEDLGNLHDSFGVIAAGPHSRFWTLGNQLMPIDFNTERRGRLGEPLALREFDGRPVAIHPRLNLAASYSQTEDCLILEKFSSGENLAKVKLPSALPERRDGGEFVDEPVDFVGDPVVQFEAGGNRLFFGWGQTAALAPLESLELPEEPLVLLDVPRSARAMIDQPWRLPVKFTNPGLIEEAALEVVGGPNDVTVEGGQLSWQPGERDIGLHTIRLRAEVGNSEDTVALQLMVERPAVELEAVVVSLAVDPDGKRALVYGLDANELPRDDFERLTLVGQLILVDLEKRAVVARRKLAKALRLIELTGTAAYIAPAEGGSLHSLRLPDLADDERTFIGDGAVGIYPLPGGRLAVDSGWGLAAFEEGQLKPASLPGDLPGGPEDRRFREQVPNTLVEELGAGVLCGAVVLNEATGEPQMLLHAAGLPEFNPLQPEPFPSRWNVFPADRGENGAVAGWAEGPPLVLSDYPAMATAQSAALEHDDPRNSFIRLSLVFRDLIERKRLEPILLAVAPVVERHRFADDAHLAEAADRIVVAHRDRLFVVPKPVEKLKELQEPVRLIARQDKLTAAVGEDVTLRFETAGGQGKRTLDLLADFPGSRFDPETGELRIDSAAVWEAMKQRLRRGLDEIELPPAPGAGAVERVLDPARQAYRAWFGETTPDFPFAVNVKMGVTDEAGGSDRLVSQIVLLAPRKEFEQVMADIEAERAAAAPEASPPRVSPGGGSALERLLPQITEAIESRSQTNRHLGELDRRLAQLSSEWGEFKVDLDGMRQDGAGGGMADSQQQLAARLANLSDQVAEMTRQNTLIDAKLSSLEADSSRQQSFLLVTLIVVTVLMLAAFLSVLWLLRRRPIGSAHATNVMQSPGD